MARLRYNPIAVADLQDIKKYISEDSEENAIRMVEKIMESSEDLVDFPLIGPVLRNKVKLPTKYRYLVCKPYIIFYIYEKETVNIMRILHEKRNYLSVLGL